MNRLPCYLVSIALLCLISTQSSGEVEFSRGDNGIDVIIDGSNATTFLYSPELVKPVLFPVLTPQGIAVNRGYPLRQVEGESSDHPHHTGMFFTYDWVNGEHFWNLKEPPPQIKLADVNTSISSDGTGTITSVMNWTGTDGAVILEENRTMLFRPGADEYAIDFTIKLKAVAEKVIFEDTKEGMFAIRVASWLREKGGAGKYLSSRGGKSASDIWGRRAEWVRLEGTKEGCIAGVVIMNHPESVNYPTYWHARDYGLFSANPLGQSVFQKGTGVENPEAFTLTLDKGESALFKFRMVVYDGPKTGSDIAKRFEEYTSNR